MGLAVLFAVGIAALVFFFGLYWRWIVAPPRANS
jgi:hypothetical protein